MIKFDEKNCEFVITETISWDGTIFPSIDKIVKYCRDLALAGDLPDDQVENVKKLVAWNPETDETPLCGTKKDLLNAINDKLITYEWEDYSNAQTATENAITEWISEEFSLDIEACEIFSDF